jgi:hypothetical protein
MYHFARALIAGITIAVLISGGAAAKMSASHREALEKTTAACKAEAKDMKFRWHWRKRQKYVQNCIMREACKQGLDIEEVRKRIPVHRAGENAF